MRPNPGAVLGSVLLALGMILLQAEAPASGAVVLSEIHYDPPEGPGLEFVELENTGLAPVPLAGWSLSSGVRFLIGEGVMLEARGYLVIARDPGELSQRFQLDPARVLGPFDGSLDNGGERIELKDSQGIAVDSLRYDDDAPWDSRAAGQGGSLQRVCATFDPDAPANWSAEGDPTPLAETRGARCPPPAAPVPPVGINEVHYHAANLNDEHEEFVELRNNTASAINLKGYSFAAGIDYAFGEDLLILPGEMIPVCRDAEYVRTKFGVSRAAGNFTGQLSNDGERITLLDGSGAVVDSVRYEDQGDWPVAPDGLGASLEKIRPDAPSGYPMSWKASDAPAKRNRQRVVVRGKATSSLLTFRLDGEGECLVDNLSLVDLAEPARNLVPGGAFDRGIGQVSFEGSHFASSWDPTGGPDGTGALRLRAKLVPGGKGPGVQDGTANRAWIDLSGLVRLNGPTYELSLDFTHVGGWRGLTVGLSDSTAGGGILWRFDPQPSATPGRPNTALSERLPPRVTDISRSPREPRSTDPVHLRARVRTADAAPVASVRWIYRVDFKPQAVELEGFDDGAHGDADPQDGTFGATLPALPHNTAVTFQVRVEDAAGNVTLAPPEGDPTGELGYYVNDLRPQSTLPLQHILLEHTSRLSPRQVIQRLDCQHYWTAAFAQQGDLYPAIGIRMRGASVCATPKPYLKLRFQRGREFERQHKLNFQGLWTDKSLLRERLSWDVFNDLGYPASRHEYVRVHANGKYYGLFANVENVDERMLERQGIEPGGNLYKSIGSNEEPNGGDPGPWEKKTNENGDHSDLKGFLQALHASPITRLRFFFAASVDEDRLIDYQLGQVLINNFDYSAHNHFLYHEPKTDRWFPLPWDLDLTFGKAGVFDDMEAIPGFSPWFTTAVDGEFQSFLLDRFFSDAGSWYRRAYLVRLYDALEERFTEEFYDARLSALKDLLLVEQDEDIRMWGRLTDQGGGQFPRDFLSNLERVRYYVRERRQYLLSYLANRSRFHGHERLMITELSYHPPGGEERLEFIELWNPGGQPVDLARWSIDGVRFLFPEGARAEPNEVFVVVKDPAAFAQRYGRGVKVFGPYEGSLDNKGEALRVKDGGPGHPATVDFVRYGAGGAWPREADGFGRTLELTGASTWRDNADPRNWRASPAEGGSPGFVPGIGPAEKRYRRGDVNSDGRINLADVLATLGYLYLGAGEPACLEASDLNASGATKLDDVLFLLRHLFQGAPEPIPFPGPEDCAPVKPEACGASNCT